LASSLQPKDCRMRDDGCPSKQVDGFPTINTTLRPPADGPARPLLALTARFKCLQGRPQLNRSMRITETSRDVAVAYDELAT
jgi:hypothetical protein